MKLLSKLFCRRKERYAEVYTVAYSFNQENDSYYLSKQPFVPSASSYLSNDIYSMDDDDDASNDGEFMDVLSCVDLLEIGEMERSHTTPLQLMGLKTVTSIEQEEEEDMEDNDDHCCEKEPEEDSKQTTIEILPPAAVGGQLDYHIAAMKAAPRKRHHQQGRVFSGGTPKKLTSFLRRGTTTTSRQSAAEPDSRDDADAVTDIVKNARQGIRDDYDGDCCNSSRELPLITSSVRASQSSSEPSIEAELLLTSTTTDAPDSPPYIMESISSDSPCYIDEVDEFLDPTKNVKRRFLLDDDDSAGVELWELQRNYRRTVQAERV